jgi:hypothetical protein
VGGAQEAGLATATFAMEEHAIEQPRESYELVAVEYVRQIYDECGTSR